MTGERQPPGHQERRKGARIPIEMWVEERTENERYYRRAGNLSRGGLRLEHTIPLPLGTTVHLSFTLPGDSVPVDVVCVIVSSTGPEAPGMGVKFVELSPEAEARLEAYIARNGLPARGEGDA